MNLTKDLKEHRKIFFPLPKYTLGQFITTQMLINTIDANEETRRTPGILNQIFKQLEILFEGHILSVEKILSSFYDLDNASIFESKWNQEQEVKLQKMKEIINNGEFKINKQTEPRILCQTVLDFLESLAEPAISLETVSHLSKLTQIGLRSREIVEDQLSNQLRAPRDYTLVFDD